jgi:hypothetical protein
LGGGVINTRNVEEEAKFGSMRQKIS